MLRKLNLLRVKHFKAGINKNSILTFLFSFFFTAMFAARLRDVKSNEERFARLMKFRAHVNQTIQNARKKIII
jgi:hypothetical protein